MSQPYNPGAPQDELRRYNAEKSLLEDTLIEQKASETGAFISELYRDLQNSHISPTPVVELTYKQRRFGKPIPIYTEKQPAWLLSTGSHRTSSVKTSIYLQSDGSLRSNNSNSSGSPVDDVEEIIDLRNPYCKTFQANIYPAESWGQHQTDVYNAIFNYAPVNKTRVMGSLVKLHSDAWNFRKRTLG